jgi:hypothetical protein
MDVKQGSFRSLCLVRWPVLGSDRSNAQTHRLRRLRQSTSALLGHFPSPRRAPQEFNTVRFRSIPRHEDFNERLVVFAIEVDMLSFFF